MSTESEAPEWTRTAHRLDRPKIDRWWKPEDGIIDGFLVWQGDGSDRQTGETYHAFAVREGASGIVLGIAERAALRALRQARPGTRVYIKPAGRRDIGGGREMLAFEVYAAEMTPTAPPAKTREGSTSGDGGGSQSGSDGIPF
jgi:hypothetical protein